ncbi:helix-turn-helix domain-containing protein [Pseudomonas rhodesiae]|uniref:helix-turn-helix domain-containing protein n=1 Tax=Pseudomonas rhodesiae TaxID=76760 RepID=UPI00215E669B|nr:helix-turn-helix transcriptional regulator [Pseudomonas rhodesiae]UVL07237.1 helix-turn-helix domain-containing protein [Pseudomonas rhodesiae]
MNESFGKRLARLSAEKAMTQRDLASKAGISWSQISRYESDLAQPRLKVLMKLAEALDVHKDDLKPPGKKEITLSLCDEMISKIEEFAETKKIAFDQAVQLIVIMGMKMKLDQDPSLVEELEAEIPGAY